MAVVTETFPDFTSALASCGPGYDNAVIADVVHDQQAAPDGLALHPLAPRSGHFPGKARAVIWLFINGGPSHVDTWDYKPELAKRDGQDNAGPLATHPPVMESPYASQRGRAGACSIEPLTGVSETSVGRIPSGM